MRNAKEETKFTSDSGVNEEWLERFMDSVAFVSDEEMKKYMRTCGVKFSGEDKYEVINI